MKSLQSISLLLILMVSVCLFSCKDEEKTTTSEEPVASEASPEDLKQNMAKNSDLKYNPAHGEEGHRCDLPVGAPLENTAAQSTQPMNSSPVRLREAAPKINPPHGEPGHDCSIAVGAELK
ncbi:hypothetical protein [Christiangramia sabulilitoris]|uniref:Secreted protein n=1 Tax=Christiangramia sabulilitoris TaxID=2583991 RepID=A0A550I9L3_9FLAO|nr:hypothetical protein [Christiangramia sabulilitoris]TRO67508.1 hypothetical protein FGM01_06380 [Christiangramia sabulilitoris]